MNGVASPTAIRTVEKGKHSIARFIGDENGPTLVVVGSIHGNEPSGALALQNVAGRLLVMRPNIRGRVFFFAGNTRALDRHKRFVDFDLNRHWTRDTLRRVESGSFHSDEDFELDELFRELKEIMSTARDEVYVLDLHTTSAEGLPFATVGDTMRNRHFARHFPVTMMLGIEEQLEGTLLEYLNNEGTVTLGFEGGQHDSEKAIRNHESLVWISLAASGILAAEDVHGLEMHRRLLREATGHERIIEVRYREPITPDDHFKMLPGFNNFDPVKKGDVLAEKNGKKILSPETGLIMMPLYQKQGEDGFFVCRDVAPFWIRLSEVLRNMNAARLIQLLPGISKHPTDPESYVVNTRVARFFPLQVFHLLGFRKRRWIENRLIVSRRRHDIKSPFVRDNLNNG